MNETTAGDSEMNESVMDGYILLTDNCNVNGIKKESMYSSNAKQKGETALILNYEE